MVRLFREEAAMTVETGVAGLVASAERLARLREFRGSPVEDFGARIKQVVLLASSSRGGSSMIAEMLRVSDSLIHLRGEFNPFLRMVGLTFPASESDSDQLDGDHLRGLDPALRKILDTELALDAGHAAQTIADDEMFGLDTAWRIAVQWPTLEFDPVAVAALTQRVLARLRLENHWEPGELRDTSKFQVQLLRELRSDGLPVSSRYYDLPPGLRDEAPGCGDGAPGEVLLEEPPFILQRPWQRVGERDLATKALVIKTPSNAYRLAFLCSLFPNARIRIVHLTRNPAAAINGLYDGWLYNGFHAHRMEDPLGIIDYGSCGDRRLWWKFDLPPGWREYTHSPLVDVCAFQWRMSHQTILADLDNGDIECLRIRFEDLISGGNTRVRTFAKLCDWLGIDLSSPLESVVRKGIEPISATRVPSLGRWHHRADKILPAINEQARTVAVRLGYGNSDSWI